MHSTVFVVLKNSDFTEGRGPMLFHKVFDTASAAKKYVSKQSGIYGTKQNVDEVRYENGFLNVRANGYIIEECSLLTENYMEDQIKMKISMKQKEIVELQKEIEKLKAGVA